MAHSSEEKVGSLTRGGKILLYILVAIAEMIALATMILLIHWKVTYYGGFAWDGTGKEFNYHPVFMILGFLIVYGNSAIIYRVAPVGNKKYVKLLHALLNLLSFIFAVIGLVAVFNFHNFKTIANMYSLHSWVGMGTVLLYSFQLLFGFTFFLWPKANDHLRAEYLESHVYFGSAILAMAVVSIISGLTEKVLFSKIDYSDFIAQGNIANIIGTFAVLFSLIIGFILHKPAYKRSNRIYEIDQN